MRKDDRLEVRRLPEPLPVLPGLPFHQDLDLGADRRLIQLE